MTDQRMSCQEYASDYGCGCGDPKSCWIFETLEDEEAVETWACVVEELGSALDTIEQLNLRITEMGWRINPERMGQ